MQRRMSHDRRSSVDLADAVAADDRQRVSPGATSSGHPPARPSRHSPHARCRSSSSAMPVLLAEIDFAHAFVGARFAGRALREHRACNQNRNLFGETEDDVHVVLDDQHRDVGIEARNHIEDEMAFATTARPPRARPAAARAGAVQARSRSRPAAAVRRAIRAPT